MSKDNEWNTIDVSQKSPPPKVEFEIEGQEQEQTAVETKKEIVAPVEKNEEKQSTYEVDQIEEAKAEPATATQEEEQKEKELAGIETRGAQKRIRQLIRQRKERDEEINRLRLENEKLQATVGYRERELTNTVKNTIESTQSQLKSRLEQAKVLYKKASEQGDADSMLAAQEEISKAYAEEVALRQQHEAINAHSVRLEEEEKARPARQTKQAEQANPQPQYDPKAIDWARKNAWFGKDQLLTNAALSVDAELKKEGFDPSDDEYYEEVDARLAAQFPSMFNRGAETRQADDEGSQTQVERKAPPSKPSQVVSGASRSPKTSSGSGKNKVKLTQRDVALANKWGIPLEQYAAEKLKAEQAEGDYTTVQ